MSCNYDQLGMTLSDIFSNRYVVPLYQRNFAWRTDEIQQLLQDIWDSWQKSNTGNYYIGSLVVMKRHNGDYEVIDGQQRLTVISLIAVLMGKLTRPMLLYDSRPEVQDFFELLCRDSGKPDAAYTLASPSLFYLKEACDFIRTASVEKADRTADGKVSYSNVAFLKTAGIAEYFMNHVVLVRNEIPEDTDVAAYFEIMNNRGEQLQKHEIVKAQMMANIADKRQRYEFAKIWDACSQMDIPIQRLFSGEDRNKYFGDNYDNFCFQAQAVQAVDNGCEMDKCPSLKEILESDSEQIRQGDEISHDTNDTMETEIYTYGSIIDFPNFLMHVLRLYLSKKGQNEVDVPLNEKELLNEYKKYQNDIDPIDFVGRLLFCRTAFDRFIVKTVADAEDLEDGRKWVLIKPKKYNASNWKFISSFDDDKDKLIKDKLIKALSMLQVTFRNRIYKTWLYDALHWLYMMCHESGILSLDAEQYLNFLHKWMWEYYKAQNFDIRKTIPAGEIPSRENSYSQGTSTSHFLLNFIDYLYYCRDKVSDFDFKYWNSIEHHLAQHKAVGKAEQYVDCLGNLYLISRSANSRLSDRDVKEKVTFYKDKKMGPNRQIIYAETAKANYEWEGKQIAEHYNDIVDLLSKCRETLHVQE